MTMQFPITAPDAAGSLRQAPLDDLPRERNSTIGQIRERALETIRCHFPLMSLFTPELKIDLGAFIKDQMLFQSIAECLTPLLGNDSVDPELIAKHFENHPLLAGIKAMFTADPTAYLRLFYEACADVTNKKPHSTDLRSAIEGRIFTLKNGLVAQIVPQALRGSQAQHNLVLQEVSSIKEEGANFIRESIRLHLFPPREGEKVPFKKLLIANAEQLIPFVQKVTIIYLREKGKSCPDNSLTFRNPSGYNHHGLVAATVMEACLDVLGYMTSIMGREDLEPKVTLATAHKIVAVMGPDKSRYLVDPTYLQFHKDICAEDALLPTASVLVLEEDEVDNYIESNLMLRWKANAERILKTDDALFDELERRDQLISYEIQNFNLPKEYTPSDPEVWVRKSLQRVWSIRTYRPIRSDQGFQDIFCGQRSANKTHEYVKAMGIAALSRHSSDEEVEKRLNELLKNPTIKGKNSTEALTLVAQLPTSKRRNYVSLFESDPRVKRLDVTLNAYFCSLRKNVNPDQKDLRLIYGCSGADCMTVLLATDAKDFLFVDLTQTSYQEFVDALAQLKAPGRKSQELIEEKLEKDGTYLSVKQMWGGAPSHFFRGKHSMHYLALKILFDLRETGVDLNKVILSSSQNGLNVRIDFPWQYHGAPSLRMRSLTFVTADITKPEEYPPFLKTNIEAGFDIFYMKAAFLAPLSYPQFLPALAKFIKPGGWLMTADKTSTMEMVNPEECLDQNGISCKLHRNAEMQLLEDLMNPAHDPFASVPFLDSQKQYRFHRMTGSDLSYWAFLSLRQKKS